MAAAAARDLSGPLIGLLAFSMLLTVLLQTYSGYLTMLIPSEFYLALDPANKTDKTKEILQENVKGVLLGTVIWVIPFGALVNTVAYLIENLLYLKSREYLTRRIFPKYMRHLNFYKIGLKSKCDNPDQRLTQDLNNFCKNLSSHFRLFFKSAFGVAWYTFKTVDASGWTAVALIYGYALFGTVVNGVLLPYQSKQTQKVAKCEGNYRDQQLRIKTNKETIALANSADLEQEIAFSHFAVLIIRQKIFIYISTVFTFSSQLIALSGSIIPYLIVCPTIFNNDPLDTPEQSVSSYISKYTGIYMMLMYNFTTMIESFPQFGTTLGFYKRIKALSDQCHSPKNGKEKEERKVLLGLKEAEIYQPNRSSSNGKSSLTPDLMSAQTSSTDLSNSGGNKSPDILLERNEFGQTILIKNLTLSLERQRTLLVGRSGGGKSSLVRVLAKITDEFKNASGPDSDPQLSNYVETMIVPQNYTQVILPRASWLEQLCYPESVNKFLQRVGASSSEQYQVPLQVLDRSSNPKRLKSVEVLLSAELFSKIEDILPGLGLPTQGLSTLGKLKTDWLESFSNGELQRIIMARVLFRNPKYLILDETVSNLDSAWCREIFKRLSKTEMKYLTISHDLGLGVFHDAVLNLDEESRPAYASQARERIDEARDIGISPPSYHTDDEKKS